MNNSDIDLNLVFPIREPEPLSFTGKLDEKLHPPIFGLTSVADIATVYLVQVAYGWTLAEASLLARKLNTCEILDECFHLEHWYQKEYGTLTRKESPAHPLIGYRLVLREWVNAQHVIDQAWRVKTW